MATCTDAETRHRFALLREYGQLYNHTQTGLFVLPDTSDENVWHGVVFIRQGLYEGGIFRFRVVFSSKFPEDGRVPEVQFFTSVFHPLVDPKTGALKTSPGFPEGWRPHRNAVWQLLRFVKSIFFQATPTLAEAANMESVKLWKEDREGYYSQVKDCVKRSDSDEELYSPCYPKVEAAESGDAKEDDSLLTLETDQPSLFQFERKKPEHHKVWNLLTSVKARGSMSFTRALLQGVAVAKELGSSEATESTGHSSIQTDK